MLPQPIHHLPRQRIESQGLADAQFALFQARQALQLKQQQASVQRCVLTSPTMMAGLRGGSDWKGAAIATGQPSRKAAAFRLQGSGQIVKNIPGGHAVFAEILSGQVAGQTV